ncbi:hypothetical protein ACFYXJ_26595 [Streptomyces sp. NPDC002667]|uniref:hypothetical protein n=1 Tax=Streptomyces sp. NPDC002667 TaxID=3364657 RepID=UPI0036C8831F
MSVPSAEWADLRARRRSADAGQDRSPRAVDHSARRGRWARGWATAGTVAALFLVAGAWRVPAGIAVAGGTAVAAGLRTRAALRRRREAEEAARHWAQLRPDRHPAATDRSRNGRAAFAALAGAGLLTAAATATLLLTIGPEDVPYWLPAVAPTALTALFLLIASRGAARRAGP